MLRTIYDLFDFPLSKSLLAPALIAVFISPSQAIADMNDWKHSGSMYIVTTSEGANLPASALEKNFPLLVRLNRDYFDFSQAKSRGEDIRFSANGKPLAYQIERWDAAGGNADVGVRIPTIKGNDQQAIKMQWGNDKVPS